MIRQLVASYVLLVAVALAGFTVPVALTLTGQLRGDTESAVRREAETAALLLGADDAPSRQALVRLADAYERETRGELDVLSADRTAVAPLPLPVEPGDAAFTAALAGRSSARWGQAAALRADGLVLAVPARSADGRLVGAVRISYPSAPLHRVLARIWGFRAALAAAVLVVAGVLGGLLARRLTRPLRELNRMAGHLRDGDLTARAQETGPPETRTLARTLNNATETIDTLVQSQRAFIADASHQLRTPLTALRLSLDNIADDAVDPTTREDIDQATAEVVRMSRLVNGLLALALAESTVTAPERVRVADVVTDRFDAWRAVADERGVRLRADTAEEDLYTLTSHGHLEQVLDNVLSNALEVSPDGGAVTVSTRRHGDQVMLTVSDQGPGMSAAERQRAFDRFWRGQGLTGPAGSGLGLAIVKQLVIDDGGTVSLDEAPGGGLCVRIHLRAG